MAAKCNQKILCEKKAAAKSLSGKARKSEKLPIYSNNNKHSRKDRTYGPETYFSSVPPLRLSAWNVQRSEAFYEILAKPPRVENYRALK